MCLLQELNENFIEKLFLLRDSKRLNIHWNVLGDKVYIYTEANIQVALIEKFSLDYNRFCYCIQHICHQNKSQSSNFWLNFMSNLYKPCEAY